MYTFQVMDPSGRFLRAFGSQGTSDGKFNYPWGVTTDALGFIYVCDKENHRVQVIITYLFAGYKLNSCWNSRFTFIFMHLKNRLYKKKIMLFVCFAIE